MKNLTEGLLKVSNPQGKESEWSLLAHWLSTTHIYPGPGAGTMFSNLGRTARSCEHSVQFSSVAQSCPTLCDPMDCSTPGLPVHHQPLEFTQTHVHWVGDAIQPSHPLTSASPPTFNLSQRQCLSKTERMLDRQIQYGLTHTSVSKYICLLVGLFLTVRVIHFYYTKCAWERFHLTLWRGELKMSSAHPGASPLETIRKCSDC